MQACLPSGLRFFSSPWAHEAPMVFEHVGSALDLGAQARPAALAEVQAYEALLPILQRSRDGHAAPTGPTWCWQQQLAERVCELCPC